MGIPDTLRHLFHDLDFWETYLFIAEAAVIPDVVAEFDVGEGFCVVLDIHGTTGSLELGIRGPGSSQVLEVAWSDWAHPHPFAFRWNELDLVCRAVAALDSSMPYPGPALALLGGFVSIHDDDDVNAVVATVRAGFESLRPAGLQGDWLDIDGWLQQRDYRGQDVWWSRDGAGNLYATQDCDADRPFYSLRYKPNDGPGGFPYDTWRALLAQARNTIEAVDAAAAQK